MNRYVKRSVAVATDEVRKTYRHHMAQAFVESNKIMEATNPKYRSSIDKVIKMFMLAAARANRETKSPRGK